MVITNAGQVGIGTVAPNSSLDMTGVLNIRQAAAPAVSPTDQGRIYFDSTVDKFRVSEHGGAFVDLLGASDDLGNHTATADLDMNGSRILNASQGTVGTPSLSFISDPNTGLYSPGADKISVATNGSEVLSVDAAGNVGIGFNTPGDKLEINGPVRIRGGNQLRFAEPGNVDVVTLNAPVLAADVNLILPPTEGSFGEFLQTDGSGVLTWQSAVGPLSITGAEISDDSIDGGKLDFPGTPAYSEGVGSVAGGDLLLLYNTSSTTIENVTVSNLTDGLFTHDGSVPMSGDLDLNANLLNNLALGSSANPGLSLDGDANTGLFSPGADILAITTNGNEAFRVNSAGKIGIGTTAPTSPLDVQFNDTGFNTTASNLHVDTAVNPIAASTQITKGISSNTHYESANNLTGSGKIYGVSAEAFHNSTSTVANLYGQTSRGVNSSTGTVTSLFGSYSQGVNSTSGSVTNMYGTRTEATNNGSGSIGVAYGIHSKVTNGSAGAGISTAYAAKFDVSETAGTITNGYGVYTGNIQATNKFSIYASDNSAPSYFAAGVGVGITAPQSLVHIDGAGAAQGLCVTSDGACGAVPQGGQISAEQVLNTGADYAEYFEAEEELNKGDLVGLNEATGLARNYQAGDSLLGIVSTAPGIVGNSKLSLSDTSVLVGLVGQVPFNKKSVTEKNGKVFTVDGKPIGYILASGMIYINLSSADEFQHNKIVALEKNIIEVKKQNQILTQQNNRIQAYLCKIDSSPSFCRQ